MSVRIPPYVEKRSADKALVLHVLVSAVDDAFEAHCLEMDIVTEAADPDRAFDDCCDLIVAQYRAARDEDNLENLFFPAPPEYWKALATAKIERSKILDLDGDKTDSLKLQELIAA